MVWGSFTIQGKFELVFVDENMDSDSYINILTEHFLPWLDDLHTRGYVLQKDNVRAHSSMATSVGLITMDWQSRSIDENLFENVWAIMARSVFRYGRQFDDLVDLKGALIYVWDNIPLSIQQNLVKSMISRCISIIEKRCGPIAY